MTIKDALLNSAKRIRKTSGSWDHAWSESEQLLTSILKKDRVFFVSHPENNLSSPQQKQLDRLIKRRAKEEPMAYLLGTKPFHGRDFVVNKHVLIPRPETEELVEHVLLSLQASSFKLQDALIWDVGTGSGAIAVTLKAECPKATVIASDVDSRALAVAKRNAKTILKKSSSISFFKGSLLTPQIQKAILKHKPKHLTIIANLPYVPLGDKKVLSKGVVLYEPAKALFAKNEGRFLIESLLQQAAPLITKRTVETVLFFEFDPPQAHTLTSMAKKQFPNAQASVHKDSCGRNRILLLRFPRKSGRLS